MKIIGLLFIQLSIALAADEWVLHVPNGAKHAEEVAELHGLDFLGEVVPESKYFHFKQSANRAKRSLDDLTDGFAKDDRIHSHAVQDEVKRVKRVPLPQSEGPRSTGNQLCFINTIEDGDKEGRRCIFPFSYKGKTYLECTADHSSNEAEWCATQVDTDGEVINGEWGDCDKKSLSCLTIGAGSLGQSPAPAAAPSRPAAAPSRPAAPPRAPPRFRPPPNFQGQQGFPQGFPPLPQRNQQGPPRGFPQQGGAPPRGFPPQGFPQQGGVPPRSFPQQPQGPPQANRPQQPSAKSSLPPQFGFDPSILFGLANKLAGGGGAGQGGEPGSQKPEETFPEIDRSGIKTNFNDEAWPYMWYLNKGEKGLDMNVEDAWEQGYTGKGVVVTILDDGVEHDHPDLNANYDEQASIDLNDNDGDPYPRYDFFNSNKHGTRCAGTVAAAANNSACAVGIAHEASIGGVRILDGPIRDVLEAKAISFNRDYIDIYSASWGPDDDGKTIDGPGPLAKLALADGVKKGRNGKGSIFVWASGNGGKHLDNCNCDGYTTSPYTLSVSSVSELGLVPWYSEPCSSSLATTFSSGATGKNPNDPFERKVITTDLHGRCTAKHTGTSASSPMAAGMVALALEANPELTWRDVQHIVVRTSIPAGHLQARDWATNYAGHQFSHSYGFGLMDAGAMVRLAKDWQTVPEGKVCTTNPKQSIDSNISIKGNSEKLIELDASNCGAINHMEHLHLLIDLTSGARRGDLSVILKSPAGTQSVLLGPRPEDQIRTGFSLFKTWPMMSVHYWGEPVVVPDVGGVWTLTIDNRGDKPCVLNDWQIRFYGTETDPQPDTVNEVPETVEEEVNFEDIPTEEDTIVEITPDEYEESEDTTAFTEDFENLEILNERIPVE